MSARISCRVRHAAIAAIRFASAAVAHPRGCADVRVFGMLAALVAASPARAQPSGPAWRVGFQPTAQVQASQTLSVTIVFCDKSYPLSSSRTITYRGEDVTSSFSYSTLGFGVHACASYYSGTAVYGAIATGSVTLTGPGVTDTLKASAYNANGTLLSGSKTWKLGDYTVAVTPHGATATPAPNATGVVQPFYIRNFGNGSTSYSLQVVSCGGAASSCSAPASVSVAPGAQATVNVSYNTGAADAKGTIELKASRSTSYGTFSDVGTVYTSPTTASRSNTRVLVSEVNPGTSIDRASCLVFSIGRDLASECGALRVTHALPSVRTLNKTRSPTLIYYGDHVRGPVLAVHVLLADTATVPDSVRLEVFEVQGGVPARRQMRTYGGAAWASSRSQRLSAADSLWGATRILEYRVELRMLYGTTWKPAIVATGELAIVNRLDSRFGAGWWLAGVERLFPGQGDTAAVLWVGGDGSTRKYVRSGILGTDTVYRAETIDRPDTLFRDAQGAYRRPLPSGVRVHFDSTGLHTRTVNLVGHVTRFVWGAASGEPRLDSVVVPTPTGVTRAYHFRYDAGGRLYSILAPGDPSTQPREVLLHRKPDAGGAPGRGVNRITDPNGESVTFDFQSWGPDYAYGARIDRRLSRTDFANEANAPTVGWVSTVVENGEVVRHDFRTVAGIGASSTASAVPLDSAYLRHDGARTGTDSVDVTKFWLDRFGAPTRIVNAHGKTTIIRRDDWRFPGSVTRVEYPALADGRQRVVTASFDARGNLKTSTEVNPYGVDGNNRDALTRFEYDDTSWPSFVTRIVPPERDSVIISYNMNGTRASQRDARGSSTIVRFNYGNAWKLLSSVVLPGGAKDSVEYSTTLANVSVVRSPEGEVTTIAHDALGRDTLVRVPVDETLTAFRSTRTVYDRMDRVDTLSITGDSTEWRRAQTLWTANEYDGEGNLTRLARWSDPDIPVDPYYRPSAIGHIVTRWEYDRLHRVKREYAPDGTPADTTDNPFTETHYDPAGNMTRVVTRRGHEVASVYDALNRPTVRTVDSVMYGDRIGTIQNEPNATEWFYLPPDQTVERDHPYPRYPNDATNNPDGFTIRADTARFAYDALGNVIRADNRDALVRRGYYLNGLVRGDTLKVRTVAAPPSGSDTTQHVYALGYRYDLNGRRTQLTYPSQLAPTGGWQGTARYAYDPAGNLALLTDPLGYSHEYEYNSRGEWTKWSMAHLPSLSEQFSYDLDGNLTGDLIDNPGVAATYRDATFTYYPEGKLKNARNSVGTRDSSWATYSALGHLVVGGQVSHGTTTAASAEETRVWNADALGNNFISWSWSSYYYPDESFSGPAHRVAHAFEAGTGRLAKSTPENNWQIDTVQYDRDGNIDFERTLLTGQYGALPLLRDRVSYFGADGRLRATEQRSYQTVTIPSDPDAPGSNPNPYLTAFEEYRYDALGRRILVVTRRYCYNDEIGDCNLDWVRRTVWDGADELFEIQMPLDAAYIENDAAAVSLPVQTSANTGQKWDPNPFYGRVAYAHALGIDRPQSIIRIDYVTRLDLTATHNLTTPIIFPTVAIVPLWDRRGHPEIGLYADRGFNAECQTQSGQTYCVNLRWPGKHFAYDAPPGRNPYWHGTLLENKQDGVGLHYRRNRYYDPKTGRFTQEDPIGLAGGLNLYGYANGDPVNHSDPFGLCPNGPKPCSWFGNFLAGFHAGVHELSDAPAAVDQESAWFKGGKFWGRFAWAVTSMQNGAAAGYLDPQGLPGSGDLPGSDRQFGSKFGEHMDSSRPGYRTHQEYRARANEVYRDPNSTRTTFSKDAAVYPGETHIRSGDDLLRLDPQGNFRSMYPVTPPR